MNQQNYSSQSDKEDLDNELCEKKTNEDEEYFSRGRELPEGYVELYNGNIARLNDVKDIDDLADLTDYYK